MAALEHVETTTTPEERIAALEEQLQTVCSQWQENRRHYQRRAAQQEKEITRLHDRLQAAHEAENRAWSLVPAERQIEEIKARTTWHENTLEDGSVEISAECVFRGCHFHVVDRLSPELMRRSRDSRAFLLNDVVRRIRDGLLSGACQQLGIRPLDKPFDRSLLFSGHEVWQAIPEQKRKGTSPLFVSDVLDALVRLDRGEGAPC